MIADFEIKEFEPSVFENEELGFTEILLKDTSYVSCNKPLHGK